MRSRPGRRPAGDRYFTPSRFCDFGGVGATVDRAYGITVNEPSGVYCGVGVLGREDPLGSAFGSFPFAP